MTSRISAALAELVRLQGQYRPDPAPHEWTNAWSEAEAALQQGEDLVLLLSLNVAYGLLNEIAKHPSTDKALVTKARKLLPPRFSESFSAIDGKV